MSKIIGVTVGTPISPSTIDRELKPVKSVNGVVPDENGAVKVAVPTKTSELTNDSGFLTGADLPESPGGGSGIHIGAEAPTDANVDVWIDTDEEAPESSGGSQADWNASDGEPGHVLNRTHYENGTEVKTLFDQTITIASNQWSGSGVVNLVAGNTYTVEWGGTAYECVAFATTFNGANAIALGNPYLVGAGENNNHPFIFGWAYDYGALAAGSMVDGDYTIKITEEVKAYKKLDECYLPYSARSYVIKLLKSDTTQLVDAIEMSRISYDEFADIVWNGGSVVLDVSEIYSNAIHCRMRAIYASYVDGIMALDFLMTGGDTLGITFTRGTWTPPTE